MRRARRRGKKKSRGGLFIGFFLLLLLVTAAFVYSFPQFERVAPTVITPSKIVVGKSAVIPLRVSDNQALKSLQLFLRAGNKEYKVVDYNFAKGIKSKELKVTLPKDIIAKGIKSWDYEIILHDSSLWGFFLGNSAVKNGKLIIDNTPPAVSLIAKSPTILKGGSALVIYRVAEDNLKKSYIDIGEGIHFQAIPYKKKGVYATLIAWPFNQEKFNPKIVAIDGANNIATVPLKIRHIVKRYKTSYIAARDRFIDGKITQLASEDSDYASITDRLKKFKAVNELMRQKNEALIHRYSKRVTPFKDKWDIRVFYPLHGAKRVSDFGVRRYYYYKKRENIVSTSFHVGYDFASVKHDKIYSSVTGKVVFAANNGIYGNMPLIDHGFGLYTLYGHCSKIFIKKGESVNANQVIAQTGKSGLALGDHLHFGILVQGIEVYPLEWMNKKWIKDYILAVFQKADTKLGYN